MRDAEGKNNNSASVNSIWPKECCCCFGNNCPMGSQRISEMMTEKKHKTCAMNGDRRVFFLTEQSGTKVLYFAKDFSKK